MKKILKSRFKMCKFTRKKRSNRRTVCTKMATVWVEPGDVTETALLVLNPYLHSALF